MSGWGNVLIIRHKLPDGTLVETLYGHLGSFLKTSGDVLRGEQMATIGKPPPTTANPNPLAHLHFEVRFSNCPVWGTEGVGYSPSASPAGWTDPSDFIDAHRSMAAPAITSVSPNPVTGADAAQPFTINGNNFVSGCNVTLRDLTAGQVFPNRMISSFGSTAITINPNFSAAAHNWSVEVINPDGQSSGQFNFTVATPQTTNFIATSPLPPAGGTTSGGGNYASGQSVTVTATANPGYTFLDWTENGNQVSTSASYTFTASANRNLVANFLFLGPTAPTGLTIITHGFQAIIEDWPVDMAKEIVEKRGNGKVIKLVFDSGDASVLPPGSASTNDLAASGETVLVLDWADKSHKLVPDLSASEPGWREAAGDFLANYLLHTGLAKSANATNAPIHFIGHSFGTVVNSQAIRRLGVYGIAVARTTTLDPHDQDQDAIPDARDYNTKGIADHPLDEPPVTVWTNVAFADNYWQDNAGSPSDRFDNTTSGDSLQLPVGHHVTGAANRDLTAETGYDGIDFEWTPHSRVWAWFFKTIRSNDFSAGLREIAGRGWYPNVSATNHGYAVSRDSDFAFLDMTAPTEKTLDPKTNRPPTVFNGDFRFVTGNFFSGKLPGYEDGDGPVVVDSGDAQHSSVAQLTSSTEGRSFRHRPIYFPPNEADFVFEFNVHQADLGSFLTLEGPQGSGIYWTTDLSSALPGWKEERVKVPPSLRGKWGGFTFKVEHPGLGINNAVVWVDNMRILPSSGSAPTYQLQLAANPSEGGTLDVHPAGLTYVEGEAITVTAEANDGYYFRSWSGVDTFDGDIAQVSMTTPRTATANFALIQANTRLRLSRRVFEPVLGRAPASRRFDVARPASAAGSH